MSHGTCQSRLRRCPHVLLLRNYKQRGHIATCVLGPVETNEILINGIYIYIQGNNAVKFVCRPLPFMQEINDASLTFMLVF